MPLSTTITQHLLRRATAGCIALAVIASAQSQPEAVYVHKGTKLRFPSSLADFRHTRTIEFPDPKLGTCVIYVGPGQLQLCVYNAGHGAIPTGNGSPALRDAVEEAAASTLRLTNTPPFSDGKFVLGADPKVEREGKVASATGRVFESSLKRPDGSSLGFSHAIALTAYRDHILKLAFTRPRAPADAFVSQTIGLATEFLKFNPEEADSFFVQPVPAEAK